MNYFNAIVFDLDDTLNDYTSANRIAYSEVLKQVNKDLLDLGQKQYKSDEFFKLRDSISRLLKRENPGPSCHHRLLYFKRLAVLLSIPKPLEYALSWYKIYEESYIENCRAFPWVRGLLEDLTSHGIRLFICSNQVAEQQYRVLIKLGIAQYFEDVITSEEVGYEKPNDRIYNHVLESATLVSYRDVPRSDEICFIGDNKVCDYSGPKTFGFSVIKYEDFVSGVVNEYCGRKIWSVS